MSDADKRDGPVQIRLTKDGDLARAYGLTLTAMDIRSVITTEKGGYGVYVSPEDVLRANWELDQYDAENTTGTKSLKTHSARATYTVSFTTTALAYAAILTFFFGAARRGTFEIDWLGAGAMVSHHVLAKFEIWRTVTALTLHMDFAHLAGNIAFGIMFVYLLSKETGTGIAWVSMVMAGAAGNLLNAVWQSPTHISIGASTAVFAAIGLMAALKHKWRPPEVSLRYWAPLGGGLMLVAYLGFGGGNTDIGAHVFGFFAGMAGGWWLSRKDRSWFGDEARQLQGLKLASALLAVSWGLALML